MKRVHLKDGLKQRLNEVIGTDDPLTPDPNNPDLKQITPWSVQAAMISNMRRLAKAIVGNASVGRAMKGLSLSGVDQSFEISSGIGITKNGDIVVVESNLNADISGSPDYVEVYIKHTTIEVDGSEEDGKTTNLSGKSGTAELVIDDYASAQKTGVNTPEHVENIVVQSNDAALNDDNLCYVGRIIVDGGEIIETIDTINAGLPANNNGRARVASLDVDPGIGTSLKSTIRTDIDFEDADGGGTNTVTHKGIENFTGVVDLPGDPGNIKSGGVAGGNFTGVALNGSQEITVKNGLVIAIVNV